MSKIVFASLLKKHLPEVAMSKINGYWELALNAQLPKRIFDLIVSNLYRIPLVYYAYVGKLGYSPMTVSQDQARRLILESLIEGPRYMSEIQKLFSIPADMRRDVMTNLVKDGYVTFEFCPIGNCMAYQLAKRLYASKKLMNRIDSIMAFTDNLSLYQLSSRALDVDYAKLCVFAKSVLHNGSYKYELDICQGKTILRHKENTLEKAQA